VSQPRGIVFVVDDDPSVRKASARIFRSTEFRVETFETAREFLEYPRPDLPSCLVLDVQMPGLSGVELQEQLTAQDADLPVVFMTGHGDISMAVKAMKTGAIDFLPKPVDKDRLCRTVAEAIARHAAGREQAGELEEFCRRVELLTPREHDVMKLVVTGLLNKQVAKKLRITEATVKLHRGRVMEKTGVASIAELARRCERAGLSLV
jgi:FixJ family two-component response regulator